MFLVFVQTFGHLKNQILAYLLLQIFVHLFAFHVLIDRIYSIMKDFVPVLYFNNNIPDLVNGKSYKAAAK